MRVVLFKSISRECITMRDACSNWATVIGCPQTSVGDVRFFESMQGVGDILH